MPLLFHTSRTWAVAKSYKCYPMLPHINLGKTTDGHTGFAVNGYKGGDHYVVDRDNSRDTRLGDRSHFFNFGALFSPNQAGRNCLPAVSWSA